MKNSSPTASSDVIFFDGVCNLCNAFVDFVIRRNSSYRFSSLQGQTAAKILPKALTEALPSVVLQQGDRIFTESTAALKILKSLGGVWSLAGVFLFIPKFVRDPIYRFVGRHRYSWFGRRETCRLPTPQERSRFLD